MKEKLLGLALLLLSTSAFAQANCGGVHVGGGACLPPNDPRLGGGAATPPAPVVRWADRWGAIASDTNGFYGIVTDMTSKREAEKSAIQECKNRGGGDCTIELSYYNQCAAVVSSKQWTHKANAPTLAEAVDAATKGCQKNGGKDCHVYWSGCSMAVRVK